MASLTRIQQLADSISKNTALIQETLATKGLPTPSFEHDAKLQFPPETFQARDAVIDASQELHDLLLDPMSLVLRKSAYNQMAGMKACCQYKIPDQFAPGEEITYDALAKACGLEEKPLRHILRHMMLLRIFREPRIGVVAHTAASAMLRDHKMHSWLIGGANWVWPSSVRLVDALAKWPRSEEPNNTGFNIAHDTDLPLYRMLEKDPEFAQVFGNMMSAVQSNPALDVSYINQSYDWASMGDGLVVDVGGSHGRLATSLASEFPSLRLIVQDLEATIQGADTSLPADLQASKRIEFMAHDFFNPQPVQADAYIFRWIFHNWSDKYSIQILQALIPALKPGARILVQDGCLPDPGTAPEWIEKDIRDLDLLMMTWFNAYERDIDEWRDLFTRASPRFEWVGFKQPEGSALALIEFHWS